PASLRHACTSPVNSCLLTSNYTYRAEFITAFRVVSPLLPADALFPYTTLFRSELRKLNDGKRVEDVEDVVGVGQKVQVEITKIDDRGKLSLAPVTDEDSESEEGSDN